MIPYGRQSVTDQDRSAVMQVLRSDWLTQGPELERFESALSAVTGARYAVAFSSGTAALHGAVAAAGIGAGHRVVTSPLSFVASASCARLTGAGVEFVDIDPSTLNMDLTRLPSGVDAVVAVHFAGLPLDLRRLDPRPPVVIEDAAHALGARTADGAVGDCRYSDMCAFSFHPVKAVTTGEGGAVTTNSEELAGRLRAFRNHGARRRPDVAPWYYEVTESAPNYRLTDIQAALGTSQLERLESFILRRNELAARYRSLLGSAEVALPSEAPTGWRHAYHLFPVRTGCRRRLYDALHAKDVKAQVHYIPIYRHPFYAANAAPDDFPHTEQAYERLLSLPLYPALQEEEQDFIVEIVRGVVGD